MAMKTRQETGTAAGDEELFVGSLEDQARFVGMRTLRLLATVACEVLTIVSMVLAFRALIWGLFSLGDNEPSIISTGRWYWDLTSNYPWPALFGWLVVFVASFVGIFACGWQHRYTVAPPGIRATRCSRCRVISATDDWYCGSCKTFRPAKIASLSLWLLSGLLTVVWGIHDVLMILLSLFLWRRK